MMGLVGNRLKEAALYVDKRKANVRPRLRTLSLKLVADGVRVWAENDDPNLYYRRFWDDLVGWDRIMEEKENPLISMIDDVIFRLERD